MQKTMISNLALAFLVQIVLPGATWQAVAQSKKARYPVMAPLQSVLDAGREFRNRAGS